MKHIFFLLILLAGPLISLAQDTQNESQAIFLYLNSGEVIKYNFSERPVIIFEEEGVKVGADSYIFSDISKYTFYPISTNNTLDIEVADNYFQIINNQLLIQDKVTEKDINICDLNGINYSVPIRFHPSSNSTELDLTDLTNNAYVLTIGKRVIKFIKK